MNEFRFSPIGFNAGGWKRPTAGSSQHEARTSFRFQWEYGFEDWLFRDEWLIGGWRYGFVQGVQRGYEQHVADAHPIDLLLYTREPDRRRRLVALIWNLEVLDEKQASAAVDEFIKRGWHATMRQEALAIGGRPMTVKPPQIRHEILNVRYRPENLELLPRDRYAPPDSPFYRCWRYQFYLGRNHKISAEDFSPSAPKKARKVRVSSGRSPSVESYFRSGSQGREITPEHAMMQAALVKRLRKVHGPKAVSAEKYWIDVLVEKENEAWIYEIKSDLRPMTVMRQAIGQLLEYSFRYQCSQDRLVTKLFFVGRNAPNQDEEAYLLSLQGLFQISIDYIVQPL